MQRAIKIPFYSHKLLTTLEDISLESFLKKALTAFYEDLIDLHLWIVFIIITLINAF